LPPHSINLWEKAAMLITALFGAVQRYLRYRTAVWAQVERASAHAPLHSR
jgi:hypothetical protein